MTNVIKVALSSRVAVDTVETESKSSPKIKATTTTTKNKRRAVMKAIRIHQQAIWPPPTPKYLMAAVPVTLMALFLLSIPAQAFYHQLPPVISGLESPGAGGQRPIEYQLIGEAGQPIRLPCLIGKQLYCGEPYFIAWYKLNMSSKSWVRFEHKSMEDSDLIDSIESSGSASVQLAPSSIAMMTGQPLANRVRFDWSPPRGGDSRQPTAKSANFKSSICSDPAIYHSTVAVNNPARQLLSEQATNFDCAQLTISSLELPDEGQYKCEITFSESLDFDKCPATTLSQLTVIGKYRCNCHPPFLVVAAAVAATINGYCLDGGASQLARSPARDQPSNGANANSSTELKGATDDGAQAWRQTSRQAARGDWKNGDGDYAEREKPLPDGEVIYLLNSRRWLSIVFATRRASLLTFY